MLLKKGVSTFNVFEDNSFSFFITQDLFFMLLQFANANSCSRLVKDKMHPRMELSQSLSIYILYLYTAFLNILRKLAS